MTTRERERKYNRVIKKPIYICVTHYNIYCNKSFSKQQQQQKQNSLVLSSSLFQESDDLLLINTNYIQ